MTRSKRRALAFAIFIKNTYPTSVLKDMSFRQMAKIPGIGMSVETCRQRIAMLKKMKLVEEKTKNGHHYFIFKSLRAKKKKNRHSIGYHRPKFAEINVTKLDMRSVASVEKGLMAMFFVETQIKKELVRQIVKSKQTPRKTSAYRKASKICCNRGYDEFIDNGISYKYIASELHCSNTTVAKVIQYGVKHRIFKVIKTPAVFMEGPEIRYAGEEFDVHYLYGNKAYYQPANRFELPRSLYPRLCWQ